MIAKKHKQVKEHRGEDKLGMRHNNDRLMTIRNDEWSGCSCDT